MKGRPKLIGYGHKARQGKGTVAKAIHCAFPKETWIFSLADALKAYCRVQGWMTLKDGRLLQMVGSEIFRERVQPDVWVHVLEQGIFEFAADYGCRYALITDVRFPNEAEWIHRSGGHLVRVDRVEPDGSLFVSTDRDPKHQSEIALDGYTGWDHIIRAQSGDLVGLASHALEAFHGLTGSRAEPAS